MLTCQKLCELTGAGRVNEHQVSTSHRAAGVSLSQRSERCRWTACAAKPQPNVGGDACTHRDRAAGSRPSRPSALVASNLKQKGKKAARKQSS